MKKTKGITLVALVITIIVLLILAGITINLTLGKNGLLGRTNESIEEHNKQEATEKINFKITTLQMHTYTNEQRLPTLQELANAFCEDEEIEYVTLESVKIASVEKIQIGEAQSFFTKLKKYPYEFEINSSLQLASINGIKVSQIENSNGQEINFQNNKWGGTDVQGTTKSNSYGLTCDTFGAMDSSSFYNCITQKNVDIKLPSKFEICALLDYNNETTRYMNAIDIYFYNNDNTVAQISLRDAWEANNMISYYFTLGEEHIISSTKRSRYNGSGKYAIVGDGKKAYCYWGTTLLASIDYSEEISIDKIEINFSYYTGHQGRPIYIEKIYMGEPFYYKDFIENNEN